MSLKLCAGNTKRALTLDREHCGEASLFVISWRTQQSSFCSTCLIFVFLDRTVVSKYVD